MIALFFVLDDPCHLDAVMDAWTTAGVRGITLLESSGVHRRRSRPNVPLFMGLGRLPGVDQSNHMTLFSLLEDESILPGVAEATQKIVGDLRAPHTGILFTLPVGQCWGLPKAAPGALDATRRPCSQKE